MNIEIITTPNKELKETGFGSLKSCNDVLESIIEMGHNVKLNLCSSEKDLKQIVEKKPDLVILAVKYLSFENEKNIWLSEYFATHMINYTASSQEVLKFDSDKVLAKVHLKNKGIKTAAFFTATPDEYKSEKELPIAFPLFLKPIDAANGNGIDDSSFVTNFTDFESKILSLHNTFGSPVLVEEYLDGKEFTVAVIRLETEELIISPIEILPLASKNGIRILGQKAKQDDCEELKKITNFKLKTKLIKLATDAFNGLNVRDYGRIDIKTNKAGDCFFMEANLVPGMTKGSSYFPKACEIENEFTYTKVIELILSKGLSRISSGISSPINNTSLVFNKLKVGVIGTSKKEDEQRFPIHPEHLSRIPKELRQQLIFEEGYGLPFGISDLEIEKLSGGIASRHELLSDIGTVIINKPILEDLEELKVGGTLWGYVHCVQQKDIVQAALNRKQTLIAFEDMFVWSPQGHIGRHTFYKNNEMAGYCAVIHALQLKGIDGHYGNQRKIVIFGFGAVSRGAIYALKAHGFRDITICTQRPNHEVREEVLDCHYVKIRKGNKGEGRMMIVEHDGSQEPLTEFINKADVIVNGIFQDTTNPTNFVIKEESSCLKPNSLIIDVSCDEGMGFFFAKPTTFKKPIIKYETINYYAVDHTPSYLWESATRSISAALIVYLSTVLAGRDNWQKDETIRKAINIEEGVIKNASILSFQNRELIYPHSYIN